MRRRILPLVIVVGMVALSAVADGATFSDKRHWAQTRFTGTGTDIVRDITVIDAVVPWLADKATWRQKRNTILADYERSGVIDFHLVVRSDRILCRDKTGVLLTPEPGSIYLCGSGGQAYMWAYGVPGSDPPHLHISKALALVEICNRLGSRCVGWDEPAPGTDLYASAKVLCHELGHTLGLDHRPDPSSPDYDGSKSCMAFSYWRPDAKDFKDLQLLHSHLDVEVGG